MVYMNIKYIYIKEKCKVMNDYKTMYFNLSGTLANTVEVLDKLSEDLKVAQVKAEEIFINRKEPLVDEG